MLHQDTALPQHCCGARPGPPCLQPALFRPPATAAHVLARRLCRLIARADTPAALALLRDHDGPPSRLVLHAFLRAADAPPCYCSPTLLSPPHASTLTLNTALDALSTQVSGGMRHKHDFAWFIPWPALLMLSPELVSHPVLRLVTALLVAVRRLLMRRSAVTVTRLWQTLLAQCEWIVTALVLECYTSSKHPVNNGSSPKL
ncbi:hypothetical protein C8J57DRAFT_1512558 [Mycena rebaudengoi]|nr:hypothetical protein C8J57DRAFT_1512558 [Mycena rebaudengoi]